MSPREKLEARRKRTSRIKNWLTAMAVAAFIGPLGIITAQVASGHDPALSSQTSTTGSTTAAAAAYAADAAADPEVDPESEAQPQSQSPSYDNTPAPVTTQQS
jgi:cytoskeletal protein RodZ